MDDLALGRAFRAVRRRRGWRQSDAAARAGISRSTWSRIERGQLAAASIELLRQMGRVLEIRVGLSASWRGGDLDRLTARGHTAMANAVVLLLVEAGWEVRPEVSFNHFGDRGVIDIVAWHASTRTLLLIELKTQLTDIGGLLATHD